MKTMTNVRDTSIDTYSEIRAQGRVGAQAQTLLDAIRPGRDYSLRELSDATGIAINAVSGRINELKKSGALVEGRRRKCRITGRTIHPVKLPAAQLSLEI